MRMARTGCIFCRSGWRLIAVAAALLAVAGFANGSAPAAVASWTLQAPATSPPTTGIFDASMAYDPATRTDVLLGATNGPAETWTWDGTTWTQQTPATSPPALYFASMAYDAATRTVVLFGGESRHGLRSDTWTWDGTTWTKQAPTANPPRQTGVAMASDAATGTVVMWVYGASENQTWAWG